MNKVLQILINAKDETAKAFKSLGDRLEKAEKSSRTFALGLAAASGGAIFLGKGMLDAAGNFEQSQIAFTTMLGSAEKADKLLREMTDFAKKTPFELRGLEEQAKKLLAYGFAEDNIIKTTRMLGDISAGVGMDKLPNLTLAFGQVKAATRLTGMELRQFSEAGVPLLDALAQQFGKTAGEIQEMVSDGQIGFSDVEKALQGMTGEGGKFYNMMENQSKSLGGMISNLRDAWDIFLRNEGKKLLDWGKLLTSWVIDFVQNTLPQIIDKITEATKWFSEHRTALIMVAGAITGALVPAAYAMISAFVAGAIALAPFMIAGAVIAGLVAGIMWIVQHWELIKQKAGEIWSAISEKLSGIWEGIKAKAVSAWGAVANFFSEIWNTIQGVFNYGLALITGLMISFLDWIMPNWRSNLETLLNFLSQLWEDVKMVFENTMSVIRGTWESSWSAIKDFIYPIFKVIKEVISGTFDWIKNAFKVISDPVTKAWDSLWSGIKNATSSAWEGIKNVVKESINWIIDKINWFIRAANTVALKGAGTLGISIPTLSEIPKLAEGGIITKPTIAMIGEAGPEAVIPLKESGSMGKTINVYVTGNTFLDEYAAEKMGNMIIKKLGMSERYAY